MKFASTRLVAADIQPMVAFYELLTGYKADWLAPVFAEIVMPGAVLAIGGAETVSLFKNGSAEPCANRTAILEFMVADVDAEFARLKDRIEVVHEPKDLPWAIARFNFPTLKEPVLPFTRLSQTLRSCASAVANHCVPSRLLV